MANIVRLFFIGVPKVTTVDGRNSTGSPIVQSTIPATAVQLLRYKPDLTSIMSQISCQEQDQAAVIATALASVGVSEQITQEEADALIDSGEYR